MRPLVRCDAPGVINFGEEGTRRLGLCRLLVVPSYRVAVLVGRKQRTVEERQAIRVKQPLARKYLKLGAVATATQSEDAAVPIERLRQVQVAVVIHAHPSKLRHFCTSEEAAHLMRVIVHDYVTKVVIRGDQVRARLFRELHVRSNKKQNNEGSKKQHGDDAPNDEATNESNLGRRTTT